MKQCTLIAENMFTRNHSTISLNGQTTLVTEVHRGLIPLTNQIELIIPVELLRVPPLACERISCLCPKLKSLLLFIGKALSSLFGKELDGDPPSDIRTS